LSGTRHAERLSRGEFLDTLRALLSDSAFATTTFGVALMSLDDGTILFEQNSRKLFHPASNMKLLTTATALHRLPPGYRFTTAVTSSSRPDGGTVRGDLTVRGGGDPMLSLGELDSLASLVAARGIRVVTGDLVADVSKFDTLAWGKGWMWDDDPDVDFPYIGPLTVNRGMVTVNALPARRAGERPIIGLDPEGAGVRVLNDATTTDDTLVPPLAAERIALGNTFRLTGRISPASGGTRLEPSVIRPAAWFLALFRTCLAGRGVQVLGADRVETLRPAGTDTLALVTRELDSVMTVVNKVSDNLGAELLLKTIAAESGHLPGSAAFGLTVVRSYLAEAEADTAAMLLADGSGVSWYTQLQPEALLRLLKHEFDQKATFTRFRATLPVAGVDGTLASRMRGTAAQGNAAAKTGTISGVSTLAGYVTSADGRPLGFVLLHNHFPGPLAAQRALQNSVLALLARTLLGQP
jgi:D-alanyl-D-alanine carboxypeptidase/D-alanyl-D-alanine-endopeptidase (penicillin-binding protein 4)